MKRLFSSPASYLPLPPPTLPSLSLFFGLESFISVVHFTSIGLKICGDKIMKLVAKQKDI